MNVEPKHLIDRDDLIESLQEWGHYFRGKQHFATLTILRAKEQLQEIEQENVRLRAIFPKVLESLGSGACSSDSSLEFLERIPDEVALVVKGLKRERDESNQSVADVLGKRDERILKLRENISNLACELAGAQRIAESYRQVWDKLSELVDETPNPDPLPWKKEEETEP